MKAAGLKGRPRYLEFSEMAPEYKAKYCLDNCVAENNRSNNEIIYGWVIWQDKKHRFIEAEFHAVLKGNGELLDITPRCDDEKTVLFIPDDTRTPDRIDTRTWKTWSNIKSQNGHIYENCRPIEMKNSGMTIDEKVEIRKAYNK